MKKESNVRRAYEAPRVVAREYLKEITLYTGFNASGGRKDRQGGLIWHMEP